MIWKLLSLALLLQHPQDDAAPVDVCAVVLSPEAFEGRRITISGYLLTDWHHGSLIADPTCERGVSYRVSEDEAAHASAARISALRGTLLNPDDVTMTVTGIFRQEPAPPNWWNIESYNVIYIERFERLDIAPRLETGTDREDLSE